jgi:hypothetical protein
MNAQNCQGCTQHSNNLASILGTALYRSMNSTDPQNRSGMPAAHHAKTHHGLKSLFRRRR